MRLTPIFQKRHFDWLADFARTELNLEQTNALALRLERSNPVFDRERFLRRAECNTAIQGGTSWLRNESN